MNACVLFQPSPFHPILITLSTIFSLKTSPTTIVSPGMPNSLSQNTPNPSSLMDTCASYCTCQHRYTWNKHNLHLHCRGIASRMERQGHNRHLHHLVGPWPHSDSRGRRCRNNTGSGNRHYISWLMWLRGRCRRGGWHWRVSC